MSNINKCLISKDNGQLQIPYADYVSLMEKVKEGQTLNSLKSTVISNLSRFLEGNNNAAPEEVIISKPAAPVAKPPAAKPAPKVKKVAVEFSADEPVVEKKKAPVVEKKEEPVAEVKPPVVKNNTPAPKVRNVSNNITVPPIKKDISEHFNKLDESGRLFGVFKQYYTCLNDTCGGTVRVTMKDGFCSLWNYDEWEEFAFVDIFEGHLRVSVDPRYTGAMQSLSFCEVPRLLSSRRKLISVRLDDLSNTMLDLLVKAFAEVGLTTD